MKNTMVWGIFIRSLILTDITTKWLRCASQKYFFTWIRNTFWEQKKTYRTGWNFPEWIFTFKEVPSCLYSICKKVNILILQTSLYCTFVFCLKIQFYSPNTQHKLDNLYYLCCLKKLIFFWNSTKNTNLLLCQDLSWRSLIWALEIT